MFNWIKNFLNIWKKDANVNLADNNSWVSKFYPIFNSPDQLKQLNRSDYLSLYKSWTYWAITTIADSVSDLNYQLLAAPKSSREINHKYMKFITSDFLETVSSFLKLNWECYFWKVMIWNTIDELIPLRPDLIYIEQDVWWNVTWYRYNLWSANYIFQREELLIFKNFSPFQSLWYEARWIGDVQAVAVQAETDNAVINWNWNFFRNNASAWDIIETPEIIDDDVKKRFSTSWNNKFRWVNNAHKLAILDWWLKFVQNSRSQKEMDFVEQRRFTRDEILWIFKVPKAIIGLWEWVNVWNVKAFEIIFAKRTIKPLATQIQEVLNRELFKWVWYFSFINIVPTDTEELRLSLDAWAITINEYRKLIWLPSLDKWNVLKLSEFQVSEPVSIEDIKRKDFTNSDSKIYENINIKSFIKKELKWTDEYEQKKWEKKILRNDEWEKKYNKELQKIFLIQEKDILKQINDQKWIDKPKWNELKYLTLYHTLISPIQKDLVKSEWDIALEELSIDAAFQIWDPASSKWLKDNINKFAIEIDNTTKNQIFDEIDKWNKLWLWVKVIANNVSRKFNILKTSRAESIVRTETIRASSFANQKAWEDSDVVESKQWWTAIDERVCKDCGPLHWKIIKLKDDFFKKGQTTPGWLKLNYSNTPASPLHPRCRCSLIAIIKEIWETKKEDELEIEITKEEKKLFTDFSKDYIEEKQWKIEDLAKDFPELSLDEIVATRMYSGSSTQINSILRGVKLNWMTEWETKKTKWNIFYLNESLSKMTKYNGVSSRWLDLTSEWIKKYISWLEKGSTYKDKWFLSTTQWDEVKNYFKWNVFFKINWKNWINISPLSIESHEQEILFKPSTEFTIDKIKKLKNWNYKIEMTEK